MMLIADSGSTKTHWCLINEKNEKTLFETEGYNPYHTSSSYITKSMGAAFTDISLNNRIKEVWFYGSGCYPETSLTIINAITAVFPHATIHAEMDLLAAARALLGKSPGFAAILGTGTNTCLYDGNQITENIDSLGYILGDEGSGTALGKRLLRDYLRGNMPQEWLSLFTNTFHLSKDEIFKKIYSEPLANRFCSSFVPFIHQNKRVTYFSGMVDSCFFDLFANLVSKYPNYRQYTFNCIGSVAHFFSDELKKGALKFEMRPGIITQSPMEGLIRYHQNLSNIQS